jgi:hypothetical protein
MTGINWKKVWLAAIVGGVVWTIWSWIVGQIILGEAYSSAMQAGQFLTRPRYPYFAEQWTLILFLLSLTICWFWAGIRDTYGSGVGAALKLGVLMGFAAGFPENFATATWSPVDRVFPLWWLLDMLIGSILVALIARWVYRTPQVTAPREAA